MKGFLLLSLILLSGAFAVSCGGDNPDKGKQPGRYYPSKDPDFNPSAPALAGTVGRIDLSSYWKSPYDCWDEMHALSKVSVKTYSTPLDVIKAYKDKVAGVVVYDPAVPSTSDVASSVAGVENLIAIRYNPSPESLYSKVVGGGLLPVKVRLVNEDGSSKFTGSGKIPETERESTGSAKCDAYYWFIDNYIKKAKCNTRWGGYYIDQFWLTCPLNVKGDLHCLTNHDFFVSKKGFFMDLSPWNEVATDDPDQAPGTDLKTLKDLLMAAYETRDPEDIGYVGGFPSWAHKYTDAQGGARDAVATEWEFSRILSQYNCCMDADAINTGAMANASFWQHFPLKDKYPQDWVSRESLKERGLLKEDGSVNLDGGREYYIFYVGDWDSAAWIYQQACAVWDDPQRGSVPLMWAIGPALCLRAPQVMHYFYTTATPNDYFVAADNGAGYLNPGELQTPRASGLPSGIDAWKKHCAKYYEQWGMTVTGFIIDGFSSQMREGLLDAYAEFSPNGIVPQKTTSVIGIHKGMPILRASDILGLSRDEDPVEAGNKLVDQIRQENASTRQRFHICRVVLGLPSWYKTVVETAHEKKPEYILLDAPSFFELLRISKEK